MEYIVSLSSQTKSFLFSLGFGVLVGILYDALRVIRITISESEFALYITDFIFVFVSSIATFLFCLTVTDGEIRLYILFGEVLGFLIYYFSFGVIAIKFSEKTVKKIKSAVSKILRVLAAPFIKIFSIISSALRKNVKKSRNSAKKLTKNLKILLQINKPLLYNLHIKMHNSDPKSHKAKAENKNESEKE